MTQGYMNHVVIEDDCPKCEEPTAIDLGMIELSEFPKEVELGCDDCQHEWVVTLNITLEDMVEAKEA
jgi:hypothetical protein